MIDMGFPPHIVDLIRSLYRKQQSAVRSAAGMTEWFKIGRGVRQGCILSSCLFNLYAEAAMREALKGYSQGFQIGGRVINNLRYADDVVLTATSPEDLQELINRVRASSEKVGLLINTEKNKSDGMREQWNEHKDQPQWRSFGRCRIVCVFGLIFHQGWQLRIVRIVCTGFIFHQCSIFRLH